MEMIMFFGFPFSFGLLEIRIGIVFLFFCINRQDLAFSPSSVDLCFSKFAARLNFLMRHFHRRILDNIILLFLSFSNTERREGVFRTQWFIGQYCSERKGRGYRSRCMSVPLSLYFNSILWRLVMIAFHRRPKRRWFFSFPNNHRRSSKVLFFYFYNTFPHFFSTSTTWPSIPLLYQRPTGHESRRFSCQCWIKILICNP